MNLRSFEYYLINNELRHTTINSGRVGSSLFVTDGAKHLNFVDDIRNENWLEYYLKNFYVFCYNEHVCSQLKLMRNKLYISLYPCNDE